MWGGAQDSAFQASCQIRWGRSMPKYYENFDMQHHFWYSNHRVTQTLQLTHLIMEVRMEARRPFAWDHPVNRRGDQRGRIQVFGFLSMLFIHSSQVAERGLILSTFLPLWEDSWASSCSEILWKRKFSHPVNALHPVSLTVTASSPHHSTSCCEINLGDLYFLPGEWGSKGCICLVRQSWWPN